MKTSIINLTDSYKFSHWLQYPKGTEKVFSYFEARTGGKWKDVVFFGLQYLLKEYFAGTVLTKEAILEANEDVTAHMGPGIFNLAGWMKMLEKHKGTLPVRIRAVPEGSVVPISNVLMTIENTDEEFPWITNFLETLLVQIWSPCTVATQSREMKKVIKLYLEETADNILGLDFKLHDFGFRGSKSVESAAIDGGSHLSSFKGSDTFVAIQLLKQYYASRMAGFSIPASEHSTITSWGRTNEVEAMRNMLEAYPNGLMACVSDSYDIFNACANIWGTELKDKVLGRDGVLVVRPDSGNPLKIVPEVLRLLGAHFGQERNSKGYYLLNPKVRVIQGDGITFDTFEGILKAVKESGYSTDNLAFGSGGGLLQMMNRDTLRFAFKCSAIKINGQWSDVIKNPVTDGSKASKGGRLELLRDSYGNYSTVAPKGEETIKDSILQTVFENGSIIGGTTLEEVRKRCEI